MTAARKPKRLRSRCRPLILGALSLVCGCGTLFDASVIPGGPGGDATPLAAAEVQALITAAASAVADRRMVIAVCDREGRILGIFRKNAAPATQRVYLANRFVDVDTNELAVAMARTAAFFSNDQAPLSSRTVRFISREHFPPTFAPDGRTTGVDFTPSGAPWNIEGTNRGCTLSNNYLPGQDITPARSIDGLTPGIGVATTPGAVPVFRNGAKLIGGIAVAGTSELAAEFAAFVAIATQGFAPFVPDPGEIFIDGVRLPFIAESIEDDGRPLGTGFDPFNQLQDIGAFVPIPDLANPGMTTNGPQGSQRTRVPEGWLVGPNPSAELSANQVRSIVENCIFQANATRAAIRLPLDQRAKMVIAVTDLQGEVIGLFRMPDATVFSVDVAVTKARNVVYFSGPNRTVFDLPGVPFGFAITNRTLRFGTQPLYPPGIEIGPGPFFQLLTRNRATPCRQGFQNLGPNPDPFGMNTSGVVLFPGSAPLYLGGFLMVGGLGVSGDGVDQDDIVTAAGAFGYEPAGIIRADQVKIGGVRLPYIKFPRAPEQGR